MTDRPARNERQARTQPFGGRAGRLWIHTLAGMVAMAALLLAGAESAAERGGAPFSPSRFPAELRADLAECEHAAQPASASLWSRFGTLIGSGHPTSLPLETIPKGLEIDDWIEPVNRAIHEFNRGLTDYLLEPAARFLINETGADRRAGFSNVMWNLREPIALSSALLEGDLGDANNATMRFLLNSTVGVFGYFDVAADLGYRRQNRTIDQALCRQGVPSGVYVVIPVFGPSSVRDTTARVATMYVQFLILGPIIIPYRVADVLSLYMDARDHLHYIDDTASDHYVGYRSVYNQITEMKCAVGVSDDWALFLP